MRNARIIDQLVITSDNSGAIGEKPMDVVSVPDTVASYYSTRVVLLEQLAANALPFEIILLNFTGQDAWQRYVEGIEKVFREVELPIPTISGSSETNIPTLQSGFGLTMIGKLQRRKDLNEKLHWYSYGYPLVGDNLLARLHQVADLKKVIQAMESNDISAIMPVGSKGVRHELQQFTDVDETVLEQLPYDASTSAGPSTVILVAVNDQQQKELEKIFPNNLNRLTK